jgi:hypothetical protein
MTITPATHPRAGVKGVARRLPVRAALAATAAELVRRYSGR